MVGKGKIVYFYWFLAVGLFALSIYSTADYQAKKQDSTLKEMFFTSNEYDNSKKAKELALEQRDLNITEKKELQQQIINLTKSIADTNAQTAADITEIKEDYIIKRDNLLKEASKLSAKMTWRKKQIDREITKIKNACDKDIASINAKKDKDIANKETQIATLNNKIANIKTTVNLDDFKVAEDTKEKMASSNLGVVARLQQWFGFETKTTSFLVQLAFAVLFELTAIGLHLASKREQNTLLKIVSYLGFVTSAILTYLSYINYSTSIQDKLLAICMTAVSQGGSFVFFNLACNSDTQQKEIVIKKDTVVAEKEDKKVADKKEAKAVVAKEDKKVVDFNEKRKVTEKEVKIYLEEMKKGKGSGDKADSYRTIINNTNLTDYQGKQIMKILKERNVIKVEGKKTIIV